jgi:hypothetical protein
MKNKPEMMLSCSEAAELIHVSRSSVERWCQILAVPKCGTQYIIDDQMLTLLRLNIRGAVQ